MESTPPAGDGRSPVSTQAVSPPPPPPPGYLPPMYPAPPKQRGVAGKVATSVVATIFILSIVANIYAFIIFTSLAAKSETVYRDGSGPDRVVIVPVNGGIDDEMARYVRKSFKSLEDDVPAAVVLRVNSGGGGVTPSDQIWHTVDQFKKNHPEVKIVASFGGVAASGGYYIATPTDYIVCEQTGITGSIGVMASIPSVEAMIQKLGVEMNVVVADGSERKAVANNLFENWTTEDGELTEAGQENEEVLKNLLNSAWDRFVQVVDDGRPTLSTEQVKALATGDIYTAEEALENELVNQIGYLDDAVDKAIEMAGLTDADPKVTVIRQPGEGLLAQLLMGSHRSNVGSGLTDLSPDNVRTWLQDL
ncbi:MAG: S49 family peptidase, partial [Planctomycetota bacterium]